MKKSTKIFGACATVACVAVAVYALTTGSSTSPGVTQIPGGSPPPDPFDFQFKPPAPPPAQPKELPAQADPLPAEATGRHREIAAWLAKIKPLTPWELSDEVSRLAERATDFGEDEAHLKETFTHEAQQNLMSVSILMDYPDIWPGSLLQGKSVRDVPPAAISVESRTPLTVTMLGLTPDGLATKAAHLSHVMPSPSIQAYQESLTALQTTANGLFVPPRFQFVCEEAYSSSHTLFQLHADAKYFSAAVSADVESVRQNDRARVFIALRQDYYQVVIEPPASSTAFFGDSVTREALEAYVGAANPPTYVKSVTYGRFLIAEALNASSSSKLKAALQASYDAAITQFNLNVAREHEEQIKSATFHLYVRGGPADMPSAISLSGFDALRKINSLLAEPAIAAGSMGVPVAFVACNLVDNTAVALQSLSRYSVLKTRSAPYRYSVCLKGAEINDDHDGWPAGDGDFVVWVRPVGTATDLLRCARSMPTGRFNIDAWSPSTTSKRRLELCIRIGEEDSDPGIGWEKWHETDGRHETTLMFDLAKGDQGQDVVSPGDDGGNKWHFLVRPVAPFPE